MADEEEHTQSALLQLSDRMRVKRDRAIPQLEAVLLRAGKPQLWSEAVQHVKQLVGSPQAESRHGAFCAAKMMFRHVREGSFAEDLRELALVHLEDSDPLVRLAVGECLGVLVQEWGCAIYVSSKDRVLQSIESHLHPDRRRLVEGDGRETESKDAGHKQEMKQGNKFQETSLKALQHLMEGCGDDFHAHSEPQMLQIVLNTLQDENHFVREAGFSVLYSFCHLSREEAFKHEGLQVAQCLAQGLGDSWSQVRYEACKAVRMFLTRSQTFIQGFLPKLLPPMCLNRYYGAEGVRLYSQETWKIVLGTRGREMVQECIDSVIDFYLHESQACNPLAREATCYCISEIVAKVDNQILSPYIQRLLAALIISSKDPSWSVRDGACTALGRIISVFPEESRSTLPDLYRLWTAHLAENVSSVRENSAFALGSAMNTYKDDAVNKVVEILQQLLPKAKEQPSDPETGHDRVNVSDLGVNERRQESEETHTMQSKTATHSCSLSSAEAVGVTDHGFARPGQPWEASDGAVYLLRELTSKAPSRAVVFLPMLADLGYCTNFRQYPYLLETLYRMLPSIAQNLGKKLFKPFLDLFIEPLFCALSCGQRVAEVASGFCVSRLVPFIGPNIFKARLTERQLSLLASSPFVRPDEP